MLNKFTKYFKNANKNIKTVENVEKPKINFKG